MFALVELFQVIANALADAWAAMDWRRRLAAWRWTVTHRAELDRLLDVVVIEGARDAA